MGRAASQDGRGHAGGGWDSTDAEQGTGERVRVFRIRGKKRGYRGGDWLVLEILERKSLKKARTGKRAAVGEFEVSLLLTLIHIHLISFSFRLDNILNLVDFMDYFLVIVVDLVVILMIWPGG